MCGGAGTRLSEETQVRPKPLVEIGGRPILWHIMKHYSHYGFSEFVIALGYRSEVIKRWFLDMAELDGSFTLSVRDRQVVRHDRPLDDWKLQLRDTGVDTQTGGRLARLAPLLRDGTFMLTYGDGVSNVDLKELLAFHRSHGKLATVTAVRPPARFGELELDGDRVKRFAEKPQTDEGWINGGFFVLEPGVLDLIPGDVHWEREPLERLAASGGLMAYKHESFWQCMDTLRDKRMLESLWCNGHPPWKVWP
jgi:glucose-1-phosphate cytidylyltransferase